LSQIPRNSRNILSKNKHKKEEQMNRRVKHQMSFEQKKLVIEAFLLYGCKQAIGYCLAYFRYCKSTYWNIWAQYIACNRKLELIAPKPRTNHNPKSHTTQENKMIVDMLAKHPNERLMFVWQELGSNGYTRKYTSLCNYIRKHNLRGKIKVNRSPELHKGQMNRPPLYGMRAQFDVKYVPKSVYGVQVYQFSIIDEATGIPFAEVFPEKSTYSTKAFLQDAQNYFKIKHIDYQSDNGSENTNEILAKDPRRKINLVDDYLITQRINHKLTPLASPWINGCVERFHRECQFHYHFLPEQDKIEYINSFLLKLCIKEAHRKTSRFDRKNINNLKTPFEKFAEDMIKLRNFEKTLQLDRKASRQELIYAYNDYYNWKLRHEPNRPKQKYELKLHPSISHQIDIQFSLYRLCGVIVPCKKGLSP
jgi:transposase InsO family protein